MEPVDPSPDPVDAGPAVPPFFGGVRPTAIVGDAETSSSEYRAKLKLEPIFFDSHGREVVPDDDGKGFVVVDQTDHSAYVLAIARANAAYAGADSPLFGGINEATTLAELARALVRKGPHRVGGTPGRWLRIC